MPGADSHSSTTQSRAAVAVSVKNVEKSFGDQEVLHKVSFDVEAGETFVLMGPSGSGKSVLLRTIIGLLKPDGGSVEIDGRSAAEPQTHRDIVTAIVFQSGALFNSLSVFDNLALYPREHRLYDRTELRDRVEETLKMLNLSGSSGKMPSELSGGMKRRVAIARALMMQPQLILYDEPTSELDPISAANISEVIGSLKEECHVTSIVVSHDRDLADAISDRLGLLLGGHLKAVDKPGWFRDSEDEEIRDFFSPRIDVANPRFRQQS